MKERILQIMKAEQMPAILFAKEIQIQQASLSHILNGRNNASLDVVRKIHARFPRINLDWLLEGNGSMYVENVPNDMLQFDENAVFPYEETGEAEKAKEMDLKQTPNAPKSTEPEDTKSRKEVLRKVVEIKIFFNDGTYETLTPSK